MKLLQKYIKNILEYICVILFFVLFLFLLSFFTKQEKGSYSKYYFLVADNNDGSSNRGNHPPRRRARRRRQANTNNRYAVHSGKAAVVDMDATNDVQHAGKKQGKDSKGEIECARILEKIFNKPFRKIRPSFLFNDAIRDGRNLELDMYNEELRIGLEYNGRQHYEYIPYFHRNRATFQNQQYRDYIKKQLCKKNNRFLITVPYYIKFDELESYIVSILRTHKKI